MWLLFKYFFFIVAMCHNSKCNKTKGRKRVTNTDIEFNSTCYSFFGEFRENGSFQFTEPLTIVSCNQGVNHCFVEFYRLAYYTWFNGQCDNSFACIYESDYTLSNGCQATLHGGDRCCCSNKLCNFDIILKERPYFAKYLPQQQVLKRLFERAPICGLIKNASLDRNTTRRIHG
uniref:Activin_recp domain-containing protein n=1 Tax=Wuchereria bancrofti TaxID=6293 RepID=A0AAF5PWI0_WUCBA